jgi:hypothetical protein
MAVSNIGVQVFQYAYQPTHVQSLHVKRFDFIPSSAFLISLLHAPENGLKLSPQDVEMFQKL